MFVRIMNQGRFLGRAGLAEHARPLLLSPTTTPPYFMVGTRLGQVGLRSSVYYAGDVRDAFRKLVWFAKNTGFALQVFTTSAQSKALFNGRLVNRAGSGQSYVINGFGEVK